MIVISNNILLRLLTTLSVLTFSLSLELSQTKNSKQGTPAFPTFQTFVQEFHKHYDSQHQYNMRHQIYLSNIQLMKSSHCDFCGVNFYADWTPAQIKGLRTVKESETKNRIGATTQMTENTFFSRILTESIPETFDWRNFTNVTEVKSQGYCGASWAFSTAAFFQQQSIIEGITNQTIDLSEMYLIGCNPENQGCRAGQIESSLDLVIKKGGIPYEKKYSFNPSATLPTSICFETELFQVSNASRMSYYRIYDSETIKQIILKKPVIASVCAADLIFYQPSSGSNSSRMLRCKPQNRVVDHSVLLVGYTETEWIVKNHWGKNWGVNGYAYISRNQAEDCCIGEQLHTTGTVTVTCSVEHCQTCVENDTCYYCEEGRFVKHNIMTGVQTCELCTSPNCTECNNYKGTCKLCVDGFAINSTTGICVPMTISNCNRFQSYYCMQCKPGYRLNPASYTCSIYCSVKNCIKCTLGPCTSCKTGFSLKNVAVSGQNVQYCILNNCYIGNCTYCNETGSCVQCANGFILTANGTCISNCTNIAGCASCTSGSTTCSECVSGKSWNSTKKVCEAFNPTPNCKTHKIVCTACKSGFQLNSIAKLCMQTCEVSICSSCLKNDITYCTACSNGYYVSPTIINNITYASLCVANPCNITNCTLCVSNGIGCLTCATKYLTYNYTSKICENQCKLANCRDCILGYNNCEYCNPGYSIDYYSGGCIPTNITNCLMTYISSGVQNCWSCYPHYLTSHDDLHCLISCNDQYCESCQLSTLYTCDKCLDGYHMHLFQGALMCSYIYPTMEGCDFVSFNQSYCYDCDNFHERNNQTGSCEKHTQGCPEICQYCSTNGSSYFFCKCHTGVYEYWSQSCIATPFNDTNCFVVELYSDLYYCLACYGEMLINDQSTGCQPSCLASNCTQCQIGYNTYCYICDDGFYLNSNSKCSPCIFDNCKSCKEGLKCLQCIPGYQLDSSGQICTKIQCSPGFLFDGYQCICPAGTYYKSRACLPCETVGCLTCSATACFVCENGYFLVNASECHQCRKNCKICPSGDQCSLCNEGFLYDSYTHQCINPVDQGGAFYISENIVIRCPSDCLECNSIGKCTQCAPGFSNVGAYCLNCIGFCKTCQVSNSSACTSCEDGYFLQNTTCLKCNDTNCDNCQASTNVCTKCKDGFFLNNSVCELCAGEGCQNCNFQGKCTMCSSGYVLMADHTCQQCGGNCKACNASAINQCLLACNQSQYENEGSCQACPIQCKTCISSEVCSSCASGYLLNKGKCKATCAQGCYECEQVNPDVCIQCFVGYMLSQVGVCNDDIACNSNQSCVVCPVGWTLINGSCEICATEGNCKQCLTGDINLCGQCGNGFYLSNFTCVACAQSCEKCSSSDRCSECKEGSFMPKQSVYGNCTPCDSQCKTCSESSSKCKSCVQGYQLSVNDFCLRVQKIEGQLQLDIALSNFLNVSKSVRNELLELIGLDVQNGSRFFVITDLREGSTLLSFFLAIPQSNDPDQTYETFQSQLSNLTTVGGVPLIAVKKTQLYKPSTQNTTNSTNTIILAQPQIQQAGGVNKLAIILGVVIPCAIILLAVIVFTFRRRLFNNKKGVDNVLASDFKENSTQIIIQVKGKLPPILAIHNTSFTPIKQMQGDSFNFNGQNRTYFNSTGFPQEQNYSKLEDPNEMSRAHEFDQTLINIVEELNGGKQNDQKRRQNADKISEFNEELSSIRGSQQQVNYFQTNRDIEVVSFEDNTGRQFNDAKQQGKRQAIPDSKNPPQKSHLQIVELDENDKQDL